ncbi:GntR family transcriptional regulator / MocR family aminotransferase [Halobacillus dabanensis]|uniref:GntR family transcriptional regulator / MocR family aminotransferase n=1 Tax=Halobacillus dabanensis TaxID=240302 RepID=A0A1I3S3S5_HALDA|nr:PLP-dependent aminotransferase family protein [Halobacillus dabanensis]SFJ53295.1 GntR family transcriptional regulator / MocR family aminotransferase [Halobacillus dabanensis]
MIFLQIDKTSQGKYIYQQIYAGIKESILQGKIEVDEKLPSKRVLADRFQVSINSVSNAYGQLLAEGYIYTIERKGYFVENINQFIGQQEKAPPDLPNDLREKHSIKEGWLSLSHMTADISKFPFKKWLKCQNEAIKNHQEELSEITHPQGPYLVRETISRMIALTRGVRCEPEQIIIGGGTQPLIRQLMTLQKESTKVGVENPGYSRIYSLLQSMKFNVSPINLDKKGIDINEVEVGDPNILFITPSHQFPTGIIMPISRRIELLNWAALSNERYIVEDDYDSEFKYGTDNIPSLQSLDRNQRVVYTGTFSKTLLPSLRISYMVLPPELLRTYRHQYSNYIHGSNSLSLFTLHYFIESGEYERHIKRMNLHYETKRKLLMKQLQETFKDDIDIKDVPAGLHFFAHLKTNRGYEEIHERAEKEKLELYSIERFTLNNKYKGAGNGISLVLGFATIKVEDIPEAVGRLRRIIK